MMSMRGKEYTFEPQQRRILCTKSPVIRSFPRDSLVSGIEYYVRQE